jgi:hypothetical protein
VAGGGGKLACVPLGFLKKKSKLKNEGNTSNINNRKPYTNIFYFAFDILSSDKWLDTGLGFVIGHIGLSSQRQIYVTTDGQSASLSWCEAPSGIQD